MTSLEKKRIMTELLQVQAGRAGLELRIEEMMEEMERLRAHIAVSENKERELAEKLSN